MATQLGLLVEKMLHLRLAGRILMFWKPYGMMKTLEPSMNAYQISGCVWLDDTLNAKLRNCQMIVMYWSSWSYWNLMYMLFSEHLYPQFYWGKQNPKWMSNLQRHKSNQQWENRTLLILYRRCYLLSVIFFPISHVAFTNVFTNPKLMSLFDSTFISVL